MGDKSKKDKDKNLKQKMSKQAQETKRRNDRQVKPV